MTTTRFKMGVHHEPCPAIDDDPRLGDLLSEYLGARGFQVPCTLWSSKRLERLARGDIEVVTLDVMMPEWTVSMSCEILQGPCCSASIMLTAQGDETDRIVGLELGADDYYQSHSTHGSSWPAACCAAKKHRHTRLRKRDARCSRQLNTQRRQVLKEQCIELTTTESEILHLMPRAGWFLESD